MDKAPNGGKGPRRRPSIVAVIAVAVVAASAIATTTSRLSRELSHSASDSPRKPAAKPHLTRVNTPCPGLVLWTAQVDGADGIAVTPNTIVVASPFHVDAFNRTTGALRWTAEVDDTDSSVAIAVTPDQLVIVDLPTAPRAFALASGHVRPVPNGVSYPKPSRFRAGVVPDGYTFARQVIRHGNTTIGHTSVNESPPIAPFGQLTIVNDWDKGLRIVDASGKTICAPSIGEVTYDPSSIEVTNDIATTATADGTLYLIAADPPA